MQQQVISTSTSTSTNDDSTNAQAQEYAGQQDGTNQYGCPIIAGQSCENAVSGLEETLAAMGFSSIEEMMAAAQNM